jgi:hypothetical protein
MPAVRRFKLRLGLAILASLVGIYYFRRIEYDHPTRAELMAEIARRGAVLATTMQIKRNEPILGRWIEPNAIILVNPTIVKALPPPGQELNVVLADDESFSGDVNVAIYDRKQLGNDWNVTMGSHLRLIEISAEGIPKVIDSGSVEFIEIRFR